MTWRIWNLARKKKEVGSFSADFSVCIVAFVCEVGVTCDDSVHRMRSSSECEFNRSSIAQEKLKYENNQKVLWRSR
jgi:hypothetical protein